MKAEYALGIDIGGTFTDIVVYEPRRAVSVSHKELTTPDAPHVGVVSGIRRLFEAERIPYRGIVRVVHATTLFTNALIERKGACTGLITTEGFRDTLEMRREHKYELYDLFIELPEPIVRRRLRLEVAERMDAAGAVEQPLDEAALLARVGELVGQGVESLAIAFLHAYANPRHEQRARELESAFRALERDARSVIDATLTGHAKVTVERAGDLRFVGQGFELVTPLPAGPYSRASADPLRKAFLGEYRRIFGRVPPVGEIEIINIRVAVSAPVGRGALKVAGGRSTAAAIKGRRRAWLASRGAFTDMPVYDRYALAVGAGVKGPAIIEEASTTLVVPAKAVATVDRSGNLNVVLGP